MSDNAIISLSDIVVRHISFNEHTDSSAGNFCHDKFEIVYHENDCGYAAVEGVQYKLDSGSLILINPFAYHKVWQQGGETPSLWSVQFAKSILPEGVRDMFDAVVGDDDNSDFLAAAGILQQFQNLYAGLIVQSTGGLITEQQLGVFRQRAGNGHTLLLTAG